MRHIKIGSLALFLVFMLFGSQTLFSQDEKPEDRFQKMFDEVKERLDLTEEQAPKVEAILKAEHDRMNALREKYKDKGRSGFSDMKDEMDEIQKNTEKYLKDVLTDDQMKEYRKMKEERQEKRRDDRRGRRPGGGMPPGGGDRPGF